MKSSSSQLPPLLIEWSTSRVRVFDPITRESVSGASITECLTTPHAGRDVIVAIGQRSTFIRTLPVPSVSRDEIAKMVGFKLGPLLPLGPGEYVSGFRLGRPRGGGGHVAVVGAMKTGSLRRIHQEATDNGLRIKAVLPLAFGSWMAARSRSLADCAVAEVREQSLYVDVVANGELRYSRSIPLTDPDIDVQAEIAKTFTIAEVPPSPVLAVGSPDVPSDYLDSRQTIEYLGDAGAIHKLLFSLELPEKKQAARARAQGWIATRALLAAITAVATATYVIQTRASAASDSPGDDSRHEALLRQARKAQTDALARSESTKAARAILDVAFRPAQTFTDMIAVLGAESSRKSWLTGLTLERGKQVLLHGQAMSGDSVARYAADLAREPRFRNMKVVSANKTLIGQKPVVQFVISGHAVGNLPIDEPPKPKSPLVKGLLADHKPVDQKTVDQKIGGAKR